MTPLSDEADPIGRRSPASITRRDLLRGGLTVAGVVVATDYLTGDLAARSRRLTQAFENYNQLRVLKRPVVRAPGAADRQLVFERHRLSRRPATPDAQICDRHCGASYAM